ncbi:MAG: Ig-like domain-containing protein [Longimicrobiales bacterium]
MRRVRDSSGGQMRPGARTRLCTALGCLLLACGGDGPTGPAEVADILIAPDPATVRVGETITLQATPKDQSGNTLNGRDVTWTSVNASIASVSTTGLVTGVSEGTADVSAVVDGTVETLAVTVSPARIVSVDVRPLVGQVLVGATLQMTATPKGPGGIPLPGRVVQWSTLHPTIATVTPSGLVTGLAGGTFTVVATVEQQTGRTDLVVVDPTAPRVVSIAPFPLVEGQSATLTGLNFGATPGESSVTVDGFVATVTAGSTTSLTITVPPMGCRPARSASVQVTAGGKSGSRAHPVHPAAFTQVGVGDQLVLSGSAAACIQLEATSGFESYLVGVQSVAEDATSVIATQIVSRTGLTASGVGVPPPLAGPTASLARAPVPREREPAVQALLATHTRRHLEARRAESALLAAGLDFDAAANGALRSPIPPGAAVGQRFAVKVPPHYPGSCTQFSTIQAEVRLVTPRGHWLVDVANLSATYTSLQLQAIADEIENDVATALEPMFGALPDTDANPRLTYVISSRVSDQGWLSYPSLFDYLPTSQCAASNEGDFLYVASPQPASGLAASFLVAAMGFSVAHDFTHVIQNRALIAGGSRAPAWIEEGQAGIGEEIYAHRVTARLTRQNYGAGVMFSQLGPIQPYAMVGNLGSLYGFDDATQQRLAGAPELCTWLAPEDGGTTSGTGPCLAPGPSAGAWAFLRWLTDHYGTAAGGDGALNQGLIDTSGSGFARVEGLVGVPIETLLARFAATLYADDRMVPVEPTLDFPSWNLLEHDGNVFPAARLAPRQRGFAGFTETGSVRGASTLYYTFSASGRPAATIEVTGPAGAALSPLAQVWIVRLQ